MKKLSDEEIVRRLQSDKNRMVDNTLSYLHNQVYQKITGFVLRYKGSVTDAEDLFQDGLLIIYKLARQGKLDDCKNVEAYLTAICKNVWFKELKKRKETVDLEGEALKIAVPEVALFALMKNEKSSAIEKLLFQLGETCQQLLVYFYYDRFKMKKIAALLGFATEQVAKNKKSKCMKQLKDLLDQMPQYKENII